MDYKEASKEVTTKKPKENYVLITLGYGNKLVLPHKDGIAFMTSLTNAEQFKDEYGSNPCIEGLDTEGYKITPLFAEEYQLIKISTLMGISLKELKENLKQKEERA